MPEGSTSHPAAHAPAGGLPMVALAGLAAADCLSKDLGLSTV